MTRGCVTSNSLYTLLGTLPLNAFVSFGKSKKKNTFAVEYLCMLMHLDKRGIWFLLGGLRGSKMRKQGVWFLNRKGSKSN